MHGNGNPMHEVYIKQDTSCIDTASDCVSQTHSRQMGARNIINNKRLC